MGNAAAAAPWEFWIDAGGTFTDCLARRTDDGTILTHKLLSTGRYPGMVTAGSDATTRLDPAARGDDPAGFFAGWTLTVGDASRPVASSAPGRLELAEPLPSPLPVGTRYELGSPLEAPAAGVRWLLGLPGLDAPLPPGACACGWERPARPTPCSNAAGRARRSSPRPGSPTPR